MQISDLHRDGVDGRLKMSTKVGSLNSAPMIEAEQIAGDERLKPHKDKIDIKNKEAAALAELKKSTESFQKSLLYLQNGVTGQEGIFDYVEPTYSGLNNQSASTYFSIEAKLGAHEQTFDLNIVKLAELDSEKGAVNFTDLENPAGFIGAVTFNNVKETEPPIEIIFDGTETPQGIVNKFNNVQNDIGVWAKLTPGGTLSITSLTLATPIAFDAIITSGNGNFLPESRTRVSAGTVVPDANITPLSVVGSLTFKDLIQGNPDKIVSFNGAETATDIIDAINLETNNTGIFATLENNKIVFTSTDNKSPPEFKSTLTSNENLIPETSTHTVQSKQAAFEYDGELIYSSRNDEISTIPDIDKLTLHAPTPNTIGITLKLSDEKRVEAMEDFITEFNAMKTITHKYTTMDIDSLDMTDEEKKEFKTALLRRNQSTTEMQTILTGMTTKMVNGMSLSRMGIIPGKGGMLELDTPTFLTALHNNPLGVKAFFGYGETSSDALLSTSIHPNRIPSVLIEKDIFIDIYKGLDGIYVATLDYDGNTEAPIILEVTEEAGRFLNLKAPENSIIEGFTFFYGKTLGDGEVITTGIMQFTQGIAEININKIRSALGENGTFDKSLKLIDHTKVDLETRIERIDKLNAKKKSQLEEEIRFKTMIIQQIENNIRQMREMNKALMASA